MRRLDFDAVSCCLPSAQCDISVSFLSLKFMFSKKATKIDKIFIVDLTLCSKCQIDGEDFINFCGLLIKHELYHFLNKESLEEKAIYKLI